MKKIIKFLISIVLSVCITLIIYKGLDIKDNINKIYGYSALIVSSGSMSPELMINDIIIIKECQNYKVNDIVTFTNNDNYLVTHRIIKKDGDNYITKGDNNNSIDQEIISFEKIEGKVISNSTILKFIYNYWILLIIIILAILIFL